jgi:hypothetical protein
MNLDQAIKKIIGDHGVEILKERRFVNMLADYQVFGQQSSANDILRQVYQKGYGIQIFNAYTARDVIQINAIKKAIVDRLGYDSQKLTIIFNGFNLAFGLKPIEEESNVPSSHYDKIKIVNTRIVNCDGAGREIKKSTFSTNEIRFLTPKISVVSAYDSDKTIDFNIKISNKGKNFAYSCQARVMSGKNDNLMLQGYGSDNGYFFSPGECHFEIYVDGEIIAEKSINISKPKLSTEDVEKQRNIIKIVAIVLAVLLNIPTYFVSGWWLFLTIPITIVTCIVLFDEELNSKEWKRWMNFGFLILIFITIFTPLPWWLLIIEFYGVIYTSTQKSFSWLDFLDTKKDYD